ncbi:MAG: DNA topoisomerase I [Candidatus Woesearchaeota archaeon]
MTYELIITEKPNAADKIAHALADTKPIKENFQGVPYYKLTHNGKSIVVGCAVGHLYTIAETHKSFKYPSFTLEWKATADVDPKSFTKKYVATLKKISKDAKEVTVATDYDIEGEVIGLNVVRYICNKKDAARMKFSTLTKPDLVESYAKKSKSLDWGQAYAGEARHFLDWMYGINLSRALMHSLRSVGQFKIMSSGRVQGPSLKTIVDLEKEIAKFKPTPYWELQVNGILLGKEIESWHDNGQFTDEKEALKIYNKVKGKNGVVQGVNKSEFVQKAPVPFDLTTLQTEAYRFFGISPKHTLEIAQDLYTGGFISYPRTSSQKLPKEIGYKKILESLGKSTSYKHLADTLLKLKELVPTEGKKTDPAHPAIYPTGHLPNVKDREHKIYDLIVKRFFACFGDDAKRETVTIILDIEKEKFISKGTRTTYPGWHKYYEPYVKLEDQEMPAAKQGEKFTNKETIKHDKETQPPRRYTQASLIRELENRNLGTKATRAAIIDSLYERNYIKNDPIEATELGMETVRVLDKYCPEINDEQLTRHFEEEMEEIREKKLSEHKMVIEAREELTKLLEKFKKNEQVIGKELLTSYRKALETESHIGKCPKCGKGILRITYSKKSKRRFIACDAYPDCKNIFNMPFGKVKATEKVCEKCHYPIIQIISGRRFQETCLNNECPTKGSKDKKIQKEVDNIESGKTEKFCPLCGKNLALRKSMYGQFLGCTGYPECRYIEKIPKDDDDRKAIEEKRKYITHNKAKYIADMNARAEARKNRFQKKGKITGVEEPKPEKKATVKKNTKKKL